MPSTHTNLLVHAIFSTKNRERWIDDSWQPDLFGHMGALVKEHKAKLLVAGGIEDHVHLLLGLHQSYALAETMQLIKANSSRWINQQHKPRRKFEWQVGYGAFSLSQSDHDMVARYISRQREHHASQPFEQEYLQMLDDQRIPYNRDFVFDMEIVN